jgi:hypothetical protein
MHYFVTTILRIQLKYTNIYMLIVIVCHNDQEVLSNSVLSCIGTSIISRILINKFALSSYYTLTWHRESIIVIENRYSRKSIKHPPFSRYQNLE